ncbi:glutamate synthase large subunit [Silvibacterium dinghuense]|uniref:Glutamate synthase large subunit n=1 Tax=Silvibacterium dinghuense TaxID=1560006 RepID=A0A4Q1SH05_9BACT|nr:glutamate synthase large subunit [Silvibacterium dinghuense]RXS96440.1 glutamate synthase large subunit [Silvibacterium dinghuense]GGG90773.1 glutamate synthase [Silvibacterium dinghuense]
MGCINNSDFASAFERPQSSSTFPSISAPAVSQPAATLIDPRFERESCGVGFVATLTNIPSHDILEKALTALARLEHRGAIAADGKSGDGIGISTGIPRELLLASVGKTLADERPLAVGVIFFPQQDEASLLAAQAAFEASLATQDLQLIAWREVPIRREVLGEIALSTLPIIRHALITDATDAEFKVRAFARRLYLSRKHFERVENALIAANPQHQLPYVCSFSTSNMVYKAMCIGRLLADFYPDLTNPEFTTPYALFHQRYATNVAPSWDRAQPLRMMAHNGEINTVWGNRARMRARAASFAAEFGDALEPLYTPEGSDSTSLDETVEMLSRNGRTVAEALRMLIPPAALEKPSAFFSYAADSAEPWDGPAAIAFSDGPLVGAILDRNGLRPCRFFVTQDQLVVLGSEAGLVDLDPETIVHSGRLGPGQMLVVDLKDKKLYEDEELQTVFDGAAPEYESLLEDHTLEDHIPDPPIEMAELTRLHMSFGYSREDVNMILKPMATDGKDAIWSMGDDTPIAPLARAPRPVYAYFRQRFAQVTNPPIDSLREARVVQLHTRLGPWPHMLDKHAPLPGLSLRSPILSLAQMHDLRAREHALANNLPLALLECVLPAGQSLQATLDELCTKAIELVRGGAAILLLTDRVVERSGERVGPTIPMALALGAVHQALITSGDRARAGLAVEAGDCRDLHHAAVLLGMGAGAVCPWLALETARNLNPEKGESNTLHAFDAGLAKIMSKMGISVVDSYRSAHLFDSLGLSREVVDRCFTGVAAPLGGIGFAELEAQIRQAWQQSQPANPAESGDGGAPVPTLTATKDLPDYGWVRFRKAEVAEPHSWQPTTVKALQTVVGSARGVAAVAEPAVAWQAFSTQAVDPQPANLRDLLEIRPAGAPLPLEQIEAPTSMYKRFIASAMSLGSLSPEAHQTVTAAMNMIGAKSNTGEGGEDPAVYQPNVDLDLLGKPTPSYLLNNKVKQVASGRFGVTTEYLMHAEEIEIKVAQGAKPGEGGQLPGHKVTELIARLRHAQPGVTLISPPPHHDIYSIEDLAQLIYDLKRVNPRATVGVKLVSECGVGTVAAGVAKAWADYIVIAGHNGGTGASPLSSIKYTGNPWEIGLAEAQQVLLDTGMRHRVRLRCDGGLRTARDILIAALLGADEFAFGTAVLVALGCDMARQCHLNTCPTGIATQRPELRAKFRGRPEHLVRMFEELARDLQALLAQYGLPSIASAIGRTDLLEQVRHDGNLDLAPMLAAPVREHSRWGGEANTQKTAHPPIDEAWTAPALAAWKAGEHYIYDALVSNEDRTLGARLSGELALEHTAGHLTPGRVTFNLAGVAGQSFGAFAVPGVELVLKGTANDFVAKGLSGGEVILKGAGRAALQSELHVILGNVALYGATSGALFAAGRAGERFAVRNSGALAIVEGVGDHGCEYMTGGLAVILGDTGYNFGAGMTGGLAWVFDETGNFLSRNKYHADFLIAETWDGLDEEARQSIRGLVELHLGKTSSTRAAWLLGNWEELAKRFIRLSPKPQA